MKTINIGLIGFGTIGSGVGEYLLRCNSLLRKKTGVDFRLLKITEKDSRKVPSRYRHLLARNVEEVLSNPEIDVVIELIGGIHPAREYILKALRNRKHVVTANKALLAEEGDILFRTAKEKNVLLKFEAAVSAGVPIIKSLQEALLANEIESILGILNGTSNYVLTVMEENNFSRKQALKLAQKKGFAERNPTLDIEGIDSAHKLALLIRLAFGVVPKFSSLYREGITQISELDIKYALELGYRIKLLAIAKKTSPTSIEAGVQPALLPLTHMLSSVRGVYNAIYIKANMVGEIVFYGQGAGKWPTTSGIISDLIELAKLSGQSDSGLQEYVNPKIRQLKGRSQIVSRYYIRFMALDKPGVLAKISGILGAHNISIASVTQKERRKARFVPLVMMTHEAREVDMVRALQRIEKLNVITQKPVYIRVEE